LIECTDETDKLKQNEVLALAGEYKVYYECAQASLETPILPFQIPQIPLIQAPITATQNIQTSQTNSPSQSPTQSRPQSPSHSPPQSRSQSPNIIQTQNQQNIPPNLSNIHSSSPVLHQPVLTNCPINKPTNILALCHLIILILVLRLRK
ncbi:hypothetical protein HHI36_013244, partial [Cryptolaemus montrouzieri]